MPAFSQGALQAFRERMVAHEMYRVLEEQHVRNLDPYRDWRSSLIAENERLRRELACQRSRRPWPAVAALGGYVLLVTSLRDWLNGADPVRYWIALVALLLTFGVSIASTIHLIVGRGG